MNLKRSLLSLIVVVIALFIGWFLINKNDDKPLRSLPFFGPKTAVVSNDTIYHLVGDFSFTSQYGKIVTQEDVKDKVYVVDYFFTTCKSICPIMNSELTRVYKEFKNETDFLILSHTVDPETDSVSVLLAHAEKYGVSNTKWLFVTGNKKELYAQARKSYLLNAEEGDGGEEDFIHTQNFALIDKEKHIRGFYDGTDSLEVNRLITDIKLLLKEYAHKAKHSN